MTFPAVVFSFFVASLFGSLLHLWRNGSLFRFMLYLVLSWIGFFGGHLLAETFNLRFLELGTIHMGMGIIGAVACLGLGYWLSLMDTQTS